MNYGESNGKVRWTGDDDDKPGEEVRGGEVGPDGRYRPVTEKGCTTDVVMAAATLGLSLIVLMIRYKRSRR